MLVNSPDIHQVLWTRKDSWFVTIQELQNLGNATIAKKSYLPTNYLKCTVLRNTAYRNLFIVLNAVIVVRIPNQLELICNVAMVILP